MKLTRRYFLLLFLVLAVVTLFLPIKVHYSFEATAKIYPYKEWFLMRGQDDSYVTEMQNYETNVISHVKSYKFERGDISEVLIDSEIVSGDQIDQGDTIAYINSYFIENELIRLKNLKSVEEGNLSSGLVGEKQALIDQARQQYNFAKQQLELEEKNFNRYAKLFNDSIISTAEFEIYENSYQLAQINVDIAYNELVSAETGVKLEDLDVIRQKIESYDREINNYNKLKEQYHLRAPISGIVTFNHVLNGIVTISDTTKYILKIPVKVNNVQYLDRISGIRFSIPGYNDKLDASFIDLDETVSLLSDQQLVMAKAVITGGQLKLYPGMAVQCMVLCDRITLLNYLRRSIQLRF